MRYTAKWPVTVYRAVESVNGFGDPTFKLDEGTEVKVVAWYLTGGRDQGADGHIYEVEYDAVCMPLAGLGLTTRDQIELPGHGKFMVDKPVESWEHGPWWAPGVERVTLRRVK